MKNKKKLLSIFLMFIMLLSSVAVFGQEVIDDVNWISEPKIMDSEGKKIDVYGTLEVPENYKGNTKISLTVNGSNVNLDKDGSFTKSVFKESEIEIRVFTGKDEIVELARTLKYVATDELWEMVREAERAIEALPSLEDIRIEHKEAVLSAQALVEKAKEIDSDIVIQGEELLDKLFKKIEYMEVEAADRYFFPTIYANSPEPLGIFPYSEILFEGYVTNIKYLDKILIDKKEADIEYLEYVEVKNLAGTIVHRGSAYKFNKTLVLEDKAHAIGIEVISQSGKSGSIARRFYVDTTAPSLSIVVKDRDAASEEAELEINMKDNFGHLRLYEFDSHIYLYDRNYSSPVDQTITTTVYLEEGENTFTYTLIDGAGNETVKEITIMR